MLEGVLDAVEHRHQLAEQSLVARPVAVIRVDRLYQRVAVLEQEAPQRAQVRDPLPVVRYRMARIRLTLCVERSLQQRQNACLAHQKCTPSSTPQKRGAVMLLKGVPRVVSLMVWTPVTYCLSKRLLTYRATDTGAGPRLIQPRRASVRFSAVPIRNEGIVRQLPCTAESALQRVAPRYASCSAKSRSPPATSCHE